MRLPDHAAPSLALFVDRPDGGFTVAFSRNAAEFDRIVSHAFDRERTEGARLRLVVSCGREQSTILRAVRAADRWQLLRGERDAS